MGALLACVACVKEGESKGKKASETGRNMAYEAISFNSCRQCSSESDIGLGKEP